MTFGQEIVAITKMPYGPARTAAAESVVRRIEAENAHEVLAWALAELVEAYVFDGHGEQAFVAFSRMLRVWDENPELCDEQDVRNLFWDYYLMGERLAWYHGLGGLLIIAGLGLINIAKATGK